MCLSIYVPFQTHRHKENKLLYGLSNVQTSMKKPFGYIVLQVENKVCKF